MQQIKKTKRFITEEYDLISWVVRIFIGGAFNMILVAALLAFFKDNVPIVNGSYNMSYASTAIALQILFLIILIALSPLIASLALSKMSPKLRIVPPYYVAIVTYGFILTIWGILDSQTFFLSLLGGAGLVAVGYIEDIATTTILGIATERSNIYFEQLTVYAEIDDVKNDSAFQK